jgi:hypothetical protein
MSVNDTTEAYVTEIDGQLVLIDPVAAGVIEAVNSYNSKQYNHCIITFHSQIDRVVHFAKRIKELNNDPKNVVILLANVDNDLGAALADALMPGYDWQQFRDRGEVPFARGLVARAGIQSLLDNINPSEGEKLRNANDNIVVLVVDYDTSEIFIL